MKTAVFIFSGVEELDFVGVYEVLTKAEWMRREKIVNIDENVDVKLVGFEKEVVCANNMIVKSQELYSGLDEYDSMIIPGGRGIYLLKENESFLKSLKKFSEKKITASVCTGALVLAWAGVLEGKEATTHHKHRDKLKKFCNVVNDRVVVAENVVTSSGVSSSIDLGLKLLEILFGKELSLKVAERIEYKYE